MSRILYTVRDALVCVVTVLGLSAPLRAQSQDSVAVAAPAVRRWGDSVTLRNGLSLRLPADGVRWREVETRGSSGTPVYVLVGRVDGADEVRLQFWDNPGSASCDGWVAIMRGRFERYRRLGMNPRQEVTLTSPPFLPAGPGWSPLVWNGNACRDGLQEALVVTVLSENLTDRQADAVRTMLWYLGEAAARRQM